jgi:hypothetical protein
MDSESSYRSSGAMSAPRDQPQMAATSSTAHAPASAYTARDDARRAPTPAVSDNDAVVNDGFPSASANSFADANRSAGSFSSAVASAAETCGGTDLRSLVADCAGSAMIFMMICCAELPMCGGSPVSIS